MRWFCHQETPQNQSVLHQRGDLAAINLHYVLFDSEIQHYHGLLEHIDYSLSLQLCHIPDMLNTESIAKHFIMTRDISYRVL